MQGGEPLKDGGASSSVLKSEFLQGGQSYFAEDQWGCVCFFPGITNLQHNVSSLCTTQRFDISIHHEMATRVVFK